MCQYLIPTNSVPPAGSPDNPLSQSGRCVMCCGVQVHCRNSELTPAAILTLSPVRPPAFLPSHPNTTQGTSETSWWWLLRVLVTKKIHASNRNCCLGFYFLNSGTKMRACVQKCFLCLCVCEKAYVLRGKRGQVWTRRN